MGGRKEEHREQWRGESERGERIDKGTERRRKKREEECEYEYVNQYMRVLSHNN